MRAWDVVLIRTLAPGEPCRWVRILLSRLFLERLARKERSGIDTACAAPAARVIDHLAAAFSSSFLVEDTTKASGNNVIMRKTLLRVAKACFASLVLTSVVAASVAESNRSGYSADQANESPQHVITNKDVVFSPTRVERPAIPIGVSPFNALGRREVLEYQQRIDLNVGPAARVVGCIGNDCGEVQKAPRIVIAARALGKDKKCRDKKKGKPEDEECEMRDDDGCCIEDGDEPSNEAKTEEEGGDRDSDTAEEASSESDNNSDKKQTSDSDEKQSEDDSSENDDDDDKEKKEEEAKERAEAKEAKKKAEAEAKAKKKEEEEEKKRLKTEAKAKKEAEKEAKKKMGDNESKQSEEDADESKNNKDEEPRKSENSNSDESNKGLSDKNAEKKKANEDSRSNNDDDAEAKASEPTKDEESPSSAAKASEPSKNEESPPSEDKESEPSKNEESPPSEDKESEPSKNEESEPSKDDQGGVQKRKQNSDDSSELVDLRDSEKKEDVGPEDKVDIEENSQANKSNNKSKAAGGSEEGDGGAADKDNKEPSDSKDGGLIGGQDGDEENKKSVNANRNGSNSVDPSDTSKSGRTSQPEIGGPNKAEGDAKPSKLKDIVNDVSSVNRNSEKSRTTPSTKSEVANDTGDDFVNDGKGKDGSGGDDSRLDDIGQGFDQVAAKKRNSKGGQETGTEARDDDPSPKLKGSHHSSQPLRSKHPQSKLNSRPEIAKPPKDQKSANRADVGADNGDNARSFSQSQNRDGNHGEPPRKSSKKSSFADLDVGSGSSQGQPHHPPPTSHRPRSDHPDPDQDASNRNSQPDLHNPGGSDSNGDNHGPVSICLSNCGMRARSSMRECKANIKTRAQHQVEECNTLSEVLFDECAFDCIQARGGGPGPNYPYDRHHWPRPGGGGNGHRPGGHRPGGKPYHPGNRPRSTPGGIDDSDRSRPGPGKERPGGGGDRSGNGAGKDCAAICLAKDGRFKRRWCDGGNCPTWVDDYLQLCLGECQIADENSDSDGDDSSPPPSRSSIPSDDSNECKLCSEQKAEKLEWCKGLTGEQRSRKGIDTCTPWTNDWYDICLLGCRGDKRSESDESLDPFPAEVILCKATCKSDARRKESWCNESSKDERGISDDNCSDWADELRLKCYDDCYENARVVEGESIPKVEDDEMSSNDDKSKNTDNQGNDRKDPLSKQDPQKAEKEQRQDDIPNGQGFNRNGDDKKSEKREGESNDAYPTNDRPWIDNKIPDPEEFSQPAGGKEQEQAPNSDGVSIPEPPPHPHLPGIPDDSAQHQEQGSPAASSSSNPIDISNSGVDVDSFTVNLSIALRSGGGLETIKVRSNSGTVRADQENLRNRLVIQDGVIRVLRHIMEEELGYHVREEEWDNRVRRLRQRELVTLHHDIDQTTAHTINLGATSRDGAAVKWIKFSVVYDIVDFLTNDHSSLITGLDVTVRSAGSQQPSHLHTNGQQPHLLLTGWQIASAARAAVAGRIRDGTLLQLLRFRGVDALAVTEFGNEASVSFDQGWIDEMPIPSGSSDDAIPVTSIGARSNNVGRSWDASRLVGAGIFVLVFGLIVGTSQWAWNRRRQRREMEWTTAGAREYFHTNDVEYEEWQTRISPGEGTPSESGGSMVIDVANAIQCDKISSLGIGTASEASVIGWRPRAGRYSREPSNFSSIVHNAYDSVSPSDAALDLVDEELDANSRGQLV